jgi:hypothetical protein
MIRINDCTVKRERSSAAFSSPATMLSDVLIPLLDLNDTADPIEDYLAALRLLEGPADDVDVLVRGHGSTGGADQVRAGIGQDRA